jgi:threonine aldolase
MIDLRSDTVTRPTPGMLQAMVEAEVGDDVFGEDPTVNALEQKVARMFGMEAGLFVPSGTMGNQLGLKVLTRPGDEVLIDETGHVYNYETAAASHISSIQLRPVIGTRGKLTPDLLRNLKRGRYDWEPRTRVVAIENTTNKGGGACYSQSELEAIKGFADEYGLLVHLDGARIWNAVTATNIDTAFLGTVADTISVCFSKGLGAPVGSMLLASQERIEQARRYRKMLGGGMRQIGLLAAAADYAIEHHWPLLKEDHRRAKALAKTVCECSLLSIDPDTVETNIVIFDVEGETAVEAAQKLHDEGVMLVPFGPQTLRATFHFHITDEELENVQSVFNRLYG